MGRVEKGGWIDVVRPRADYDEWRPALLLRLTERGREVYGLLRGEEPGASHVTELLARYGSAEHAALALEAAEMLWLAGYEVTLCPGVAHGDYAPDLVAERQGERLYVECELAARAREWEPVHAAGGGRLCVVTPTASVTETVRENILAWAGERVLTLWMADLERGRTGGEVWTVKLPG
jgi:hypothetical protein